jgi:hypothetical protein
MAGLSSLHRDIQNPLDRVERLAERQAWSIDRTNDDEVNMCVTSDWSDLHVALQWRDDLESLHLSCIFDQKVPEKNRDEVNRLLNLVNARMFHGHFDLWLNDGSIVFRNSLLLTGGAEANDAQIETIIHLGVDNCQRYFPAIQFVIWAGKSAEEAMAGSLFETMGEA